MGILRAPLVCRRLVLIRHEANVWPHGGLHSDLGEAEGQERGQGCPPWSHDDVHNTDTGPDHAQWAPGPQSWPLVVTTDTRPR